MGASTRTIAVVTSSRADYNHLVWPLRELDAHDAVDLRLLVTGAHLSPEFGLTVREIEADGFTIEERLETLISADTDTSMARTIGLTTLSFADALGRRRPDLIVIPADRYEMLGVAAAALALRIPIAHIEGGERSEGAIDQSVRDALTMLSHLHLVTTRGAESTVASMGEERWRIHRVGAGSLDHLRRTPRLDRTEIEAALGASLGDGEQSLIIASFHPVTLDADPSREADAFFAAMEQLSGRLVFCYPNADAGGRDIRQRLDAFCGGRRDATLHPNLAPRVYWSLLQQADLLVGNSSSGIMEAPAIPVPSVDVGRRQQTRECGPGTLRAPAEPAAILDACHRALAPEFRSALDARDNPYGDGRAAERIVAALASARLDERLLEKRRDPAPTETSRTASVDFAVTTGGSDD